MGDKTRVRPGSWIFLTGITNLLFNRKAPHAGKPSVSSLTNSSRHSRVLLDFFHLERVFLRLSATTPNCFADALHHAGPTQCLGNTAGGLRAEKMPARNTPRIKHHPFRHILEPEFPRAVLRVRAIFLALDRLYVEPTVPMRCPKTRR